MAESLQQSRYQRWCSWTLTFLYSRPAMIVISILVVMDCLSVLGQMMVELHGMRIRFELEEDNVQLFENHMKKASASKSDLGVTSITDILVFLRDNMDVILTDRCSSFCGRRYSSSGLVNNIDSIDVQEISNDIQPTNLPCITSNHLWMQFSEGSEELFVVGEIDLHFKRLVEHESNGILGEISTVTKSLNYIGISIEAVMFVEVSVRTVCRGKSFYTKKFEVFDTVIVVVVFLVDVVFLCGNWSKKATDSATILILLLPWRFVRVIFSMITAINNKHYLQMQALKATKRTADVRLTHARKLVLQMEKDAECLIVLCKRKGATETDIQSCYCKTTTAAMSSFASTVMLISAPALREHSFYHQGSRGHLFRKVFDDADNNNNEENNNSEALSGEVVDSDCPRTLRRAGPRVVNVTPPLSYQTLGELGARVSVVEPCRRLLSPDEYNSSDSSNNGSPRSVKGDEHVQTTYL